MRRRSPCGGSNHDSWKSSESMHVSLFNATEREYLLPSCYFLQMNCLGVELVQVSCLQCDDAKCFDSVLLLLLLLLGPRVSGFGCSCLFENLPVRSRFKFFRSKTSHGQPTGTGTYESCKRIVISTTYIHSELRTDKMEPFEISFLKVLIDFYSTRLN